MRRATALPCPREGQSLVATEMRVATAVARGATCSKCQGLFFNVDDVRLLLDRGPRKSWDRSITRRYAGGAACPSCRGDMEFARVDDVWVDVCGPCRSVWLDLHELEYMNGQRNFESAEPGRWNVLDHGAMGLQVVSADPIAVYHITRGLGELIAAIIVALFE